MADAVAPVLDANGDEVVLPADFEVTEGFRIFMAGRVPAANCPDYMSAAEARAGFRSCERCQYGKRTAPEATR